MKQAEAVKNMLSEGDGTGAAISPRTHRGGSSMDTKTSLNIPVEPSVLYTLACCPPVFVYCGLFQEYGMSYGEVTGPISGMDYESKFLQGLAARLDGTGDHSKVV